MNFDTGLSSVKLFEAVYNLLSPYIPRHLYWRGTRRVRELYAPKFDKEHLFSAIKSKKVDLQK